MRKYALVILDNQDKIIDRYNLDLVTQPRGNGFELSLSTIGGDLEDILTKVVQKKNKITFSVQQVENSYQKSNILASWIQKYSSTDYTMALEYDDGNFVRYCDGKVTKLEKTEMSQNNVLPQSLEFTQLTPFYRKQEQTIVIRISDTGKKYPFTYPYSYGARAVENNEINNPYLLDVPIIITIDGTINNPTIDLYNYTLNEQGEKVVEPTYYNRVKFGNGSPVTIGDGEKLIINSAQRRIFKVGVGGVQTDYTNFIDPQFDTFLRANSGLSLIEINTVDASGNFSLTGGWRQYLL